jgi:diguanylate cyclase
LTLPGAVASFPVDGRTQSELIRKADQALYKAKKNSRNKVRLAYDERRVAKTAHFTQTQLERLSKLAEERQAGESELLREAVDDLLTKYGLTDIER